MQKKLIRATILVVSILIIFLLIPATLDIPKGKNILNNSDILETFSPLQITVDKPAPSTASILSAGDIILHSPFLSSKVYLNGNRSYDYSPIFSYVRKNYEAADFAVVNMECIISEGNYCGYPTFRVPSAIATSVKQNGADMCLLANNHIYDDGDKGITTTLDAMEENSLLYTGVRRTTSDLTYHIQDINGIKIGFFNYVYDTGAMGGKSISINALPVSEATAPLINTFNYNRLESFYNSLQTGLEEMKDAGVEYTIAYIHWGNEYQTKENEVQRQIAAQLCELGIDALIGSHPHVVQPVDLLTNSAGNHKMLCVYSLGNHLSNQRKELMDSMPTGHTEDGLMVNLVIEKSSTGIVSLKEADFIPTWVYCTNNSGNRKYFIMPLDNTSELLQNTTELNISDDVRKSLERTNVIISEGVKKVQDALPLY